MLRSRTPLAHRSGSRALLLLWAAAFAPSTGFAQELPVGVTTELVDSALRHEIGAAPVATAERSSPLVGTLWLGVMVAVAAVVLAARRHRFGDRALETHTAETRRGSDEPPSSGSVDRSSSPATEPGRESPEPDQRAGGAAEEREALVLPPHVAEVLARARAKRAAGADQAQAVGQHQDEAAAGEANQGHDFVIPAFDPWKKDAP